MRRILAIILVIVMVFFLPACGKEEQTMEIDGLKYTLLPDGTYSVSAGEDIDNYKDIIILSKIDGIAVTTISDRAFQVADNIRTLTIESGITSIGEYAFSMCENLENITLPNSLTSIDCGAFEYCESLTSIDIPDNVTTISMDAFTHCINLTKVNLPDNLITIGYSAFAGCENLTSITIPYGTKTITKAAFANCTSLKNINIPDTVTSIGYESAFNNIEGLVINFSGTKMQWTNAFGDSLYLQSKQIVHCTDGDIHP